MGQGGRHRHRPSGGRDYTGRHWAAPAPAVGRHRGPAHANVVLTLDVTSAVRWVALAVVAVAGAMVAYGQGAALAVPVGSPPLPVVMSPASVTLLDDPVWRAQVGPQFSAPATPAPQPSATPREQVPGGPSTAGSASSAASALAANGIPLTALDAYRGAESRAAAGNPACGLEWFLLAGIGRVESDHGRFAGAVLSTDGRSTPRIIGIPLNGNGTAVIRDTDGGRMDGDRVWDRALGAMQFIPSTWARYGADADGDGTADPFVIFDAAAAAADYLCAAGGDLTTHAGQVRAIYAYNHSDEYVALVLQVAAIYAGAAPGVDFPVASPVAPPTLPPVDPGRPRATTPAPTSSPAVSSPAPSPTVNPSPKPTTSPIPSASSTPVPSSTACTGSATPSVTDTSAGTVATTATSPSGTSASVSPTATATSCIGPTPTPTPTATTATTSPNQTP